VGDCREERARRSAGRRKTEIHVNKTVQGGPSMGPCEDKRGWSEKKGVRKFTRREQRRGSREKEKEGRST